MDVHVMSLAQMMESSRNDATQKAKSGSVGASWPPRYDDHNARIKAFCPFVIDGRRTARGFFSVLLSAERDNPQATRTTARAFIRSGLVESIMHRDLPIDIEARFDASYAVPGYDLVYFGRNQPSRIPDAESFSREMASVREMSAVPRTSYGEAMRRISGSGYSISHLSSWGEREVGQLLTLYQEAYQEYTFDLSRQTIADILNNGNIVIVGKDREANIVSALIAEHCRLRLDRIGLVGLYELSDYATFRSHRGNGLITLMQMEAISSIRALPEGGSSVIYAEDRAPWIAVNRSSQKAGMDYHGTLPNHCVLVSDRDFGEQGRYENLNVWVHHP